MHHRVPGKQGDRLIEIDRAGRCQSPSQSETLRVDFDPGAAFGKHRHPGEEIIYVIEGSLEYEVEGKPPITLKAGEVLFIPAGTIHAAKNVGSGNAAEIATYVVEKGKPLVELVK